MTPTTEQIKRMRVYWNIAAKTMGRVFGFGTNQWYMYEKGEPPNKSNSALIFLGSTPHGFRKMLDLMPDYQRQEMGNGYQKLVQRADASCAEIDAEVEAFKDKLGIAKVQATRLPSEIEEAKNIQTIINSIHDSRTGSTNENL